MNQHGMIGMPKGRLWDRGESGSERRAKPQRHVVNELAYCLSMSYLLMLSLREAQDNRQARKGVNGQLAPPHQLRT